MRLGSAQPESCQVWTTSRASATLSAPPLVANTIPVRPYDCAGKTLEKLRHKRLQVAPDLSGGVGSLIGPVCDAVKNKAIVCQIAALPERQNARVVLF